MNRAASREKWYHTSRGALDMGAHIINGQFQSDKYPDCPLGLIPFKVTDRMFQDLLWEYANRRASVDPDFAGDVQTLLRKAGYDPGTTYQPEGY